MKGKLVKRISKKAVIACIMAAAITVSTGDVCYVNAEAEVSGGNVNSEATEVVTETQPDAQNAVPAENAQEQTEAQSVAPEAQNEAPDAQEEVGNAAPEVQTEPISEDVTIKPEALNASGGLGETVEVTPVAPAGLSVSGTAEETPVYDGQSHNVRISLPTSTINVNGSDKTVVVASNSEGQTYFIAGLADNKVSVVAVNVADSAFDISIAETTVYDAVGTQVAAPASLKVNTSGVIQKRPVTVRSMNLIKTYDGQPLTNGETPLAEESGWVEGQGAIYTFTGTQTSVGTAINEFSVSAAKEGTDLNNYQINYTYGGISVVERTDAQKYIITIEGINSSVKYSGKEQSVSGYILEGRSDNEYQVNGTGDPTQVLSVKIGETTFYVTGISASAAGTNAGTYPVNITGSPVIRDAEGNDVTNEFKFEFMPGKFTIEKRKVILTSGSLKKKFSDKAITKHEVKVSGDGFAEGEGATYKYSGSQKKVGESYNYFTYTLKEGTDANNYDIEVVPGVLKVTKTDDTAINEEPKSDEGKNNNQSQDSQNQNDSSSDNSGSQSSAQNQSDASQANAVSDTASQTQPAASQSPEGTSVLGAKRDQVTVDISSPENTGKEGEGVLGARRSSTDDNTNMEGHLIIFAAALCFMAALTFRKDKKIKK